MRQKERSQSSKRRDRQHSLPSLEEVPIGEEWSGRRRLSEWVWMADGQRKGLVHRLGTARFDKGVELLDSWIASTAPMPGEPVTKSQKDKIRKGWNAAHSFRAWVIKKIMEETESPTEKQGQAAQGKFKGKDYYGV